jgi:hypothetical protein
MYLIFNGTKETLRAEDLLIESGFVVKTLGKPPDWEGGCGLALRVQKGELESVLEHLKNGGNEPVKVAPPPPGPVRRRLI